MTRENATDVPEPTLASLYPELTPDELAEAAARLDDYLEVVFRIQERIAQDPRLQREFETLTRSRRAARMADERFPPSH